MAWRLESLAPVIPHPLLAGMERETGSVLGSLSLSSNGPERESGAEKSPSHCSYDGSVLSFIGYYLDRTPSIEKITRVMLEGESFSVIESRTPFSNGQYRGREVATAEKPICTHIAESHITHSNGPKHYNHYSPAVEMSLIQYLHGRHHYRLNWIHTLLRSMGCLSYPVACIHDRGISGLNIHNILVSYDKMFLANEEYSRLVIPQNPTSKSSELIYMERRASSLCRRI